MTEVNERYPALPGFRAAVSRFPQGVAILTTLDAHGAPHGVTVGSFIPLSKRPPLVGVALDRRAGVLPILLAAGRFALNVLDERAAEVSAIFATKGTDRFATVGWSAGEYGLPLLPEYATSVIECELERTTEGGDHVIVVGAVLAAEPLGERPPLVYSGRRYFGIRPLPPVD